MTSIREIKSDLGQGANEVEFRFYRKDAAQVWVVGDFTNWQGGRLAMRRQADGWWVLSKPMPAGEYRFRYIADEQNREVWFTDFAAHGVEFAKGHWNGVVVVPADATRENSQQDLQENEQRLAA